jgi:hypothetical protein
MAIAADDKMVVVRDAELVPDVAHLVGHGTLIPTASSQFFM